MVEALRTATLAPGSLPPVVGALRALVPEVADRLPEAPEPLGDVRAERHRVFRALRELLASLGSTVLVLEDLQWADRATLELVRFLATQLPANLVVVVLLLFASSARAGSCPPGSNARADSRSRLTPEAAAAVCGL